MKTKEMIATAIIAIVLLICKFVLPKPIQFSPALSAVLTILLGLCFVFIFYLTIKDRPVERRIVFLFVGIALVIPFFMQFQLPLPISPEVQKAYDQMAKLQPGSKVLVSFDYDPPSAPELQPVAVAFMKYAFLHDLKVIIMGLWPQGPQQAEQAVQSAFDAEPQLRDQIKYGLDYVNLGFQSGNEFVILRMGEGFKTMFPADINYTPYDSIPLLKNVRNFSNIDWSLNLSAGKPGTVEWVQIAVDRYNLHMSAANTAVQAPMAYPYLNAGQLLGLMGGMSGAAQFEELTKMPGKATTYLLSQTFAHVAVVLFIIIGNVAFFRSRKEKK
jgi:hypothetical protein